MGESHSLVSRRIISIKTCLAFHRDVLTIRISPARRPPGIDTVGPNPETCLQMLRVGILW